jgi:hypothetical protein
MDGAYFAQIKSALQSCAFDVDLAATRLLMSAVRVVLRRIRSRAPDCNRVTVNHVSNDGVESH